jgi:hypothetical protein
MADNVTYLTPEEAARLAEALTREIELSTNLVAALRAAQDNEKKED